MLDKIDQQLEEWARHVVGDTEVSFEAPSSDASDQKIGIYLFEIRQTMHRVGGGTRPPLRFELRYLITCWSQRIKESHRALSQLLFDALDKKILSDEGIEIDVEPPPASFWNSFKCAPRPCFMIRWPIYHEMSEQETPLVTEPPRVTTTTTRALKGEVVGPNRVPIVGAILELPDLGLLTTSNFKGEFEFASVPSDPLPPGILLTVKGRRQQLPLVINSDQRIVIEISLDKLQTSN